MHNPRRKSVGFKAWKPAANRLDVGHHDKKAEPNLAQSFLIFNSSDTNTRYGY